MKYVLIVSGIILLLAVILFTIEKLIFTPFKGTAKNWLNHSDYNGRHIVFKSKHNSLNGWFYGENHTSPKGLILFSHGMGVTQNTTFPKYSIMPRQAIRFLHLITPATAQTKDCFLVFLKLPLI